MGNAAGTINRRILIIDDNENIHRDFRAILGRQEGSLGDADFDGIKKAIFGETSHFSPSKELINYEVDSAFQGEEGLEKIRQAKQEDRPYAMAFVDIRMPPGWDGLETIQRIWQAYPDIQVVICTAYSDYSWRQIVDGLGNTENLLILKKPFDVVEVYQLANAMTEKWHFACQVKRKHEELERIIEERTTLLKKTNDELIFALKEAEQVERMRNEFLVNMNHKIHTPMSNVIGFSETLFNEDLTEEQRRYVALIRQNVINSLQVINEILDTSKIEVGKYELETSECDLGQFLHGIDLVLHLLGGGKGLETKITQRNHLPSIIHTDQIRLRQCLINLINNAIKHTEKGHIHVTVSSKENVKNEHFIRFDVEDTGIGIPIEKQEAIYEYLNQSGTTQQNSIAGLELTITKQLAELLGGTLSLVSEKGEGSVFTLCVPAKAEYFAMM